MALRAGAIRAVVIDDRSPVVWGTSEPRRGSEDVELALQMAHALGEAEAAGLELCDLLDAEGEELQGLLQARALPTGAASSLLRAVNMIREGSRRHGVQAWQQHLLTARAIAHVRAAGSRPTGSARLAVQEERFAVLARGFAATYWLLLVFDGPVSELHAEAAMIHAMPTVERLVLALPPVDPPPQAGRVVAFRRRQD